MKLLPFALSALLGVASAKKKASISAAKLQNRMKEGKFNRKTLMENAKPYGDRTKEKLRRQLDQNNQEWEINGYYSIKFNQCLNVQVEDEDLLEDFMYYAQEGSVIATKSYILFSVCETENCYYEEDEMIFVTDLPSFFAAFVEYLPYQAEKYCDGCQENENYCMGNYEDYEYYQAGGADGEGDQQNDEEEDEENNDEEENNEDEEENNDEENENDEDNNEENNDENENDENEDNDEENNDEGEEEGGDDRRKLNKKTGSRKLANNKVYEYISCDLCQQYECFEDEDGNNGNQDGDDYEIEDALGWLNDLAECAEMEDVQWNGLDLKSAMICNEDGDGVEIGVFVDDDCSVFVPGLSYSYYISYESQQYYEMSSDYVEYMFTSTISCLDQEIEYINPYSEVEEEEEEEDDYNYEAPEAADWCQDVMDGDFEARNIENCAGEDDEQQEDYYYAYDYNVQKYDWYSYDLSQEQIEDEYQVCMYIQGLEGDYTTYYDSESGGKLYDYHKKSGDGNLKLPPGAIAAIVIAAIIFVGVFCACCLKINSKSDPKKVPLVKNEEGTMS